jgi:hypothetical protein
MTFLAMNVRTNNWHICKLVQKLYKIQHHRGDRQIQRTNSVRFSRRNKVNCENSQLSIKEIRSKRDATMLLLLRRMLGNAVRSAHVRRIGNRWQPREGAGNNGNGLRHEGACVRENCEADITLNISYTGEVSNRLPLHRRTSLYIYRPIQ